MFPHVSVAIQVLVTILVPAHAPGTVTSVKLISGALSQLSEIVGAVKVGADGQSIVKLLPCPDNKGGVLSSTFMVWEAEEEFPHVSVAVQVLVIE